tara:strand:+ start:1148 stop:1882 length:735 start_codon:yes stop_codon:yes gene_type:complete
MLASFILDASRFILSDQLKTRWSDARLIQLLNDGLKDVSMQTDFFVSEVLLTLLNNVTTYDISDRAVRISRIQYLEDNLPFISRTGMDRIHSNWETATGTVPTKIIYTEQSVGKFTVYPIVANSQNDNIVQTTQYGIITDISYSDTQPIIATTGVTAGYLRVFYSKKHIDITAITDTIDMNEFIVEPLSHFVAGKALRDNMDTQSRSVGQEELLNYQRLILSLNDARVSNFTNAKPEIRYNPLG